MKLYTIGSMPASHAKVPVMKKKNAGIYNKVVKLILKNPCLSFWHTNIDKVHHQTCKHCYTTKMNHLENPIQGSKKFLYFRNFETFHKCYKFNSFTQNA